MRTIEWEDVKTDLSNNAMRGVITEDDGTKVYLWLWHSVTTKERINKMFSNGATIEEIKNTLL